jgi:hypothetical protein
MAFFRYIAEMTFFQIQYMKTLNGTFEIAKGCHVFDMPKQAMFEILNL